MENTKKISHIEEAIIILKGVTEYNLAVYGDFIFDYFKSRSGCSKHYVDLFINILKMQDFSDTEIYYKKNSSIVFGNPKEEIIISEELIKLVNMNDKAQYELESLPRVFHKTRAKAIIKTFHSADFIHRENAPNYTLLSKEYLIKQLGDMSDENRSILVQFCLLQTNKLFPNWKIVDINLSFFYHIAKSLLNGEYLILKNYSDLLFEAIPKSKDPEFNFESLSIVHLYLEKSYEKIASYAHEMCFRIRKILENKKSNHIGLEIDNDKLFDAYSDALWDSLYIGKDVAKPFELLLRSIIDMTLIDHAYKSKDHNVANLMVLRHRIESLKQIINSDLADGKKKGLMEIVLKMTEIKMSNLLYGILTQDQKDDDLKFEYYFALGHERYSEVIRSLLPNLITDGVRNSNDFIKTRKEHFNCQITDTEKKRLINQIDDYVRLEHVDLYNQYIKESINSYCDISIIMQAIENKDRDKVLGYVDDVMKYKLNRLSPPLFVKLIEYISEYIQDVKKEHKNEDDYPETFNRGIQLLSGLLNKLNEYMSTYNKSVSLRYLPAFAYSFYKYANNETTFSKLSLEKANGIETYDKDELLDKFFFASVGCTPMNIEYLRRFFDKYNNLRRSLSSEYYDAVNNGIKGNIDTNKKLYAKIAKDNVETLEKIQSVEGRYTQEINDQRHQTMQILGVFAAFLAFVTITVGMIKVATSVHEFLLFCVSFTLSLLVFASHLRKFTTCKSNRCSDINNNENKPQNPAALNSNQESLSSDNVTKNKKERCNFCNYAGKFCKEYPLIIFLMIMLAILLYFIPIKKDISDNKEKIENSNTLILHREDTMNNN